MLCAPLATVTTRPVIRSSSSPVSAKWPRWFVPICISKPSTVARFGTAITPALFTSTATSPSMLSAKPRTEDRSARSSRRTSVSPGIDAAATCPLAVSRQARMTLAPARASSRAVTAPMPLFAPVTTTLRPR